MRLPCARCGTPPIGERNILKVASITQGFMGPHPKICEGRRVEVKIVTAFLINKV